MALGWTTLRTTTTNTERKGGGLVHWTVYVALPNTTDAGICRQAAKEVSFHCVPFSIQIQTNTHHTPLFLKHPFQTNVLQTLGRTRCLCRDDWTEMHTSRTTMPYHQILTPTYAQVIATNTKETKETQMLVLSQDETRASVGSVQSNYQIQMITEIHYY